LCQPGLAHFPDWILDLGKDFGRHSEDFPPGMPAVQWTGPREELRASRTRSRGWRGWRAGSAGAGPNRDRPTGLPPGTWRLLCDGAGAFPSFSPGFTDPRELPFLLGFFLPGVPGIPPRVRGTQKRDAPR